MKPSSLPAAVALATALSVAVSASAATAFAAETPSGAPASETGTCSITYTAEEIPAIAAEKLWLAHYNDASWRDALKAYNARKAELSGQLDGGEATAELVGTLPLIEEGETATGSSVFGQLFDGTSSLSPERTGHVPYGALAFMYNADDWRTTVVGANCPDTSERPAPPKEVHQVTVPEGSAVAPKEWQGALVGALALLGLIAGGMAIAPQLAKVPGLADLPTQLNLPLPQLPTLPR